MITARKSKIFEKIFAIYNRNLFKRRFNSLKISGLEQFQKNQNTNFPTIFFANHSSWWDGLVAFEISRKLEFDAFVMMEEKQLKKLFPFRFLGAFSVVRENPREALQSLNYSVKLLKNNPNRALWIFPQGKILPSDARPLKFFNGISRIIEKVENCYLIPVAISYEFLGEFKPDIFIKLGEPEFFKISEKFESKQFTKDLEEKLTTILDGLKTEIASRRVDDYQKLV